MKTIGDTEEFRQRRLRMVTEQIKARGVVSKRVIKAMQTVPRHRFVDHALESQAYDDNPLPIRENQTISQPFIVASMTEALELKEKDRVLEIGTGCGYQTAVLATQAYKVFTVERHKKLSFSAEKLLSDLGFTNVVFRVFDGTYGWSQHAPYDAIIVTAASPSVPRVYIEQLAEGGRLVIPIGQAERQNLMRYKRVRGKIQERNLGGCRFVPLIGKNGWSPDDVAK